MTEPVSTTTTESDASDTSLSRIYEVGYHIVPTVAEEHLEKAVGEIRTLIEKGGGNFIAEGAPTLIKLAYPMESLEGDKRVPYDRGYFGWIKFEAPIAAAGMLEQELKVNKNVLRSIVFKTVREDTRAKMKAPTLREVKRTDTIRTAPRRAEETSAPISEEDLDKALQDITVD
jgi:ribosomal protein S6